MASIIGKKIGMSGIFTEEGIYVPCTLVEAGPCMVLQVRTEESDGYTAVQLGYGRRREAVSNRPMLGHLERAGADVPAVIREFRTSSSSDHSAGDVITVGDVLKAGDRVNVSANSKGKGFQGVVKRYNFAGVGGRTHGQHNRERAPGSIGQSSTPSRVFKGTRMGGRTGGKRTTVRGLQVMEVLPEENVVVLKGSVPGAINSIVEINKD
jgi:large subunit ribosomal protein L3